MNRPCVELWIDFASTYSYPAAMLAEEAAAASGLSLAWRPFLLGPIFKAQGWDTSPFNLYPAKGRYMIRDMERICAHLGLPWQMPAPFPSHSLLAVRVGLIGAGEPWMGAFARALFAAEFGRGEDIADPAVVRLALAEAGGDTGLVERAGEGATKAALRQQVAEAEALGIFGAPSWVVRGSAGPEIFWGYDRMDAALDHAAKEGHPQ